MARPSHKDNVVSPPSHPLIYRLWILRRLLAVTLTLPTLAMLLPGLALGGDAASLRFGLFILPVFVIALFAMLLRFPRGQTEAMTVSVATTGLILLTPLADWLTVQRPGPITPMHVIGIACLLLVAFIAVLLLCDALLAQLAKRDKRRLVRYATSVFYPMPPERVLELVRPRANEDTTLHRTGPADAQGRIPVWNKTPDGQPQAIADRSPDYWVWVVDEAADSVTFTSITAAGGCETTQRSVMPVSEGTQISVRAASDVLSPMNMMVFWLGDWATDFLIATLDSATGRSPQRAVFLLPNDSPALWLARRFPDDDKQGR